MLEEEHQIWKQWKKKYDDARVGTKIKIKDNTLFKMVRGCYAPDVVHSTNYADTEVVQEINTLTKS